MDAIGTVLPGASGLAKVIFVVLSIVALYYLYRFLFGTSGLEGKELITNIRDANPTQSGGYSFLSDRIPALYQGGEYTINYWMYISDYSVNRGQNKHVLSLGGSNYLTLAVYLGPYKNSLHVRVHTRDTTELVSAAPAAGGVLSAEDNLSISRLPTIFGNLQSEGSLLNTTKACDISTVELQKWVQVTIVLNDKTCDVYIDGKLARSCILPNFFKVDQTNLALRMCDYRGFGGFVSNLSAYNYALNPEQIWRLYMSGPGPKYGLLDYFKGLFEPTAIGSFDYPKQNVA